MTQRKPPGTSFESFAERQIRKAQEAGEFDKLPGFGKPIPDLEDPHDELWWVKEKARRERLSLLPPSLQIRVDLEQTLERIADFETESQVRAEVAALNERIRAASRSAVWGPPLTTMPLDVEAILAEWRATRTV